MSVDPLQSQLQQRQLFAAGYQDNPYASQTGVFRPSPLDMMGFHTRRLDMTLAKQRKMSEEAATRWKEDWGRTANQIAQGAAIVASPFIAGMTGLSTGFVGTGAGMLAGSYAVNEMSNSAQRYNLATTIRREFRGTYGERILGVGNLGRGAGFFQAGEGANRVAGAFQQMAKQDDDFSSEDLLEIASRFSRRGMLTSSRTLKEFKEKFKSMKDDLKALMETMGTGMEEAQQMMADFHSMGAADPGKAALRVASMAGMAGARFGVSTRSLMAGAQRGMQFAAMTGFSMPEMGRYSAYRTGEIQSVLSSPEFNRKLPGLRHRIKATTGMDAGQAMEMTERDIVNQDVDKLMAFAIKKTGAKTPEEVQAAVKKVLKEGVVYDDIAEQLRNISTEEMYLMRDARGMLDSDTNRMMAQTFLSDKFNEAESKRLDGLRTEDVIAYRYGANSDTVRGLIIGRDIKAKEMGILTEESIEEGDKRRNRRIKRVAEMNDFVKASQSGIFFDDYEQRQKEMPFKSVMFGDVKEYFSGGRSEARFVTGKDVLKKFEQTLSMDVANKRTKFDFLGSNSASMFGTLNSILAKHKTGDRRALSEELKSYLDGQEGMSAKDKKSRLDELMSMDDKSFRKELHKKYMRVSAKNLTDIVSGMTDMATKTGFEEGLDFKDPKSLEKLAVAVGRSYESLSDPEGVFVEKMSTAIDKATSYYETKINGVTNKIFQRVDSTLYANKT